MQLYNDYCSEVAKTLSTQIHIYINMYVWVCVHVCVRMYVRVISLTHVTCMNKIYQFIWGTYNHYIQRVANKPHYYNGVYSHRI